MRKFDWSFILAVIAVGICFFGLALIVYGMIIGLPLFLEGFRIVICGLTVIIITAILLLVEDCLKKLKHRTG